MDCCAAARYAVVQRVRNRYLVGYREIGSSSIPTRGGSFASERAAEQAVSAAGATLLDNWDQIPL